MYCYISLMLNLQFLNVMNSWTLSHMLNCNLYFFSEGSVQIFPHFYLGFWFFIVEFWVLCIFWIKALYKICTVLSHSVVSDSFQPLPVAHQASLSLGILEARILEWVAMPASRGSSQTKDQTQASALHVDSLPSEPPRKRWIRTTNSQNTKMKWQKIVLVT